MIYLNGKKVEFIEFPNKERRLDLPEDMLTDIDYTSVTTQIDSSVNKVYWKYENDASIFELLLFDDAINSYDILDTCHIPVWIEFKKKELRFHLKF